MIIKKISLHDWSLVSKYIQWMSREVSVSAYWSLLLICMFSCEIEVKVAKIALGFLLKACWNQCILSLMYISYNRYIEQVGAGSVLFSFLLRVWVYIYIDWMVPGRPWLPDSIYYVFFFTLSISIDGGRLCLSSLLSFAPSPFGPVGSLWGGAVVVRRHSGYIPGYQVGMDYADSIPNVVYRGRIEYYTFPGFQVYVDYAGG